MEKRELSKDSYTEYENNLKKLRVYSTVILESIMKNDLLASTPRDILFKILLLLPFDDLINTSKTNKDLNTLLKDRSFWVNVLLGDFGLSHPSNQNAVHDDVLLLKQIILNKRDIDSVFTEDVLKEYDNRPYASAKLKLSFIIESFERDPPIRLYYKYMLNSLNNELFVLTTFNPKPNGSLGNIPKRSTKIFSLFISDEINGSCTTKTWNTLEPVTLKFEKYKGMDRICFVSNSTKNHNFSMGVSECKLYPSRNGYLKTKHIPKPSSDALVITDESKFRNKSSDFINSISFYNSEKNIKYRVILFSINYESPIEAQSITRTFTKDDFVVLYDTGIEHLDVKDVNKSIEKSAIEENELPVKKIKLYDRDHQRTVTFVSMDYRVENNIFNIMVPNSFLSKGFHVPIIHVNHIVIELPIEKIDLQSSFFSPNKRMYLYEKDYQDEQIKLSRVLSKPGLLVKNSDGNTDTTSIQNLKKIGVSIESRYDLIFIKEGDGTSTILDKNSSKLYCNHKLDHGVHKNYLQNRKKEDYNVCPVCGMEEELKKYGM